MNKIPLILAGLLLAGVVVLLVTFSSDSSNDTSSASATPAVTPTPEQTPVDPAEIVQVDTTQRGTAITVNGETQKQSVNCTKYDRVNINGSGTTVTIKGACRQVMVNGDKNQVSADAAMEFAFNGGGNQVTYSRYVNGKTPSIVDNVGGNDVQKIAYQPSAKNADKGKTK